MTDPSTAMDASPTGAGAVPVLAVEDVTVSFGGVTAVDGASLHVGPGELVGLIGPNGAGKTTLFEVVSGYLRPDAGRVLLDGEDVTRLAVHQRARRGVARGFQDAGLYPSLTVDETLRLGLDRHVAQSVDLASMLLGLPSAHAAERWLTERVDELVERFGLAGYRDVVVSGLSTGTRRVVELAAVFSEEPELLLLDEPTAGVTSQEADALGDLVSGLRESSAVTILLIEHDVPMVMRLADRVYVMEAGRMLAEGPPAVVAADPRVLEAYFGRRGADASPPTATGGGRA